VAHLRLDDLAPQNHTFEKRGVTYQLPGAVPVQTIIEAAALEADLGDPQSYVRAVQGMHRLITELLMDANPELESTAGFTPEQRERFAAATRLKPEKVTDQVLEAAGVRPEQPLRLSLDELSALMGVVIAGEAGADMVKALEDTLQKPGVELDEGDGLPPTPSGAEAPEMAVPRSRSAKR
jgi:hypothetical protein